MKIVDIHHLSKYYKSSRGIEDIEFSIEEGEIFGFIGPNGSGKSTTIRTLLNLIFPTSGSATIFGKDIVKDSKEIRQQVGYLPAEVNYYDDMKVNELLQYSAHFYKLDAAATQRRMGELAEKLDLDLHRKIEDLSFGNRKKVGIVQTLLHQPRLIMMDEPTSGLDPLVQSSFFEMLREEREQGATIFFSSHILNEVQRLCDRVAIIKEGKLLNVETVENLTKNNFKKVNLIWDLPANDTQNVQGAQAIQLEGLEGLIKQEHNGNHATLLYSGDSKSLLRKLNELPIKDILIEEPSLEEVFMHYYEK